MLLRLSALFVFMFGGALALLWVTLELKGAVTEGSDWIWFLALGLIAGPLLVFAIATARSRTRGMVILTGAATVLLAGVLLTYPQAGSDCTPAAEQSAESDPALAGLGDVQIDDADVAPDAAEASGDCS